MDSVDGNLAAETIGFPRNPLRVVTSFNQYLVKRMGLRSLGPIDRRNRTMGILPRFADEWVLKRILDARGQAPIRVVGKGGADVSPSGISPVATVVVEDRKTFAGLLRD